MSQPNATLYHGTSRELAPKICIDGLLGSHIWLARYIEDARMSGGPVVFAVDMTGLGVPDWEDPDKSDWQRCYHGDFIEPSRLKEMITND